MVKFYEQVFPFPFKNKRKYLLEQTIQDRDNSELSTHFDKKPPEPIIQVNEQLCVVNHNGASIRNLFIIPWILGLILTCYWHIDDFLDEWKTWERTINEYIESKKRGFGNNFFQDTKDPTELSMYNSVDKDGKMSFKKFLNERYSFVGGNRTFHTDVFLVFLYTIVLPGLIIWAIRFPRLAPLYFDRQRQLVYSWRKGRVWVQRYDKIRIQENIHALTFVLRGELKYGVIGWYKFLIQPHGNPVYNSVQSYQPLMAFIAQFMEFGKEHVWPGTVFESNPHFYFFKDKKPEDFEAQVENLLDKIDSVDDEPPLDQNGNPIAIDPKVLKSQKMAEIKRNKLAVKHNGSDE